MTRVRSRTRHDGGIMKAHCRIKKSIELTARAGATCICRPPAVVRFVTGVVLARQNVLHFNKQKQIHVLSFSVFLSKVRSQSHTLRRHDRRGDLIKRPDILDVYDDETLHAAFSLFNVFILPTLRHDDRSTN
ncbi:hypothetical protein ALC60_12960 [Trachymyrmex zeteki]|uniref:Uncharacterized protein n=1 Tax=Mycetomoellerius zeteki TaxID=64791 RepID=A0A151WJL3_9HYME|nr:hypothetical protein ALC60_12960 [Trachymyrmex zeteki]